MAKIYNLKPDQTLWTVTRQKMGNTTVRTIAVHAIRVMQVHAEYVIASWNGNKPEVYRERAIRRWKVKKPVTIPTWGGCGKRLATREEIKAMAQKAAPAPFPEMNPKQF